MYALVDCNNFYASCERIFNPDLRHKPIVVLSNNDGCVIAMSDEAKALNVPFGAVAFKYKAFFKKYNITVFSSNYPLYGDMSARVMNILSQFSPDIEIYSIDEAFLQFKGFDNYNFNTYGSTIRTRILKWTGIPTSVGVAPTKALSKVANKIARIFPKQTNHVYVIDSEEKRIKALQWMPLKDVWGIGSRLHKRLVAKGCKTAYDFTQLNDAWILKNLSITQWRLKKDLLGEPTLQLDAVSTKKMIATTRSFESTFSDIENIKERVATFAVTCAEKLRKQGSSCHVILVQLRSNRFDEKAQQHRINKMIHLPFPTDSSLTISKAAVHAVERIFKKGIAYKKAEVIVMGLVPTASHQLNLFQSENPKHQPLMRTIDWLNKKFQTDKVKLASQDLKRTWKMRQEHLSPRYTTHFNEIIKVK